MPKLRLLFASRPAYGHLYPMMPLAIAARDAGHHVSFATGDRFVEMLRARGFPTVRIGITSSEGMARLQGADADMGPTSLGEDGRPDIDFAARLFINVLGRRSAADLAPRLDELAPDVVVYDQGELGAPVAAGASGIPAVCHAISPRMPVQAIQAASREPLAALWADHGMQSPPFDAFTGDAYLDIVPDMLQTSEFLDEPARLTMRPVPWSEPGAPLPDRPAGNRPLVYLTLGTVVGTTDGLTPAIEALGRVDADVLVALGSAAGGVIEGLPDNVQVEEFVDQAAVLPRADLVIHHGGTGTVLGSLANGRRQLVLPKGADQFFNADALRSAGMASVLEPGEATAGAIEAAARAALAAAIPAPVLAARDEIAAMPTPADALERLLDRLRSL